MRPNADDVVFKGFNASIRSAKHLLVQKGVVHRHDQLLGDVIADPDIDLSRLARIGVGVRLDRIESAEDPRCLHPGDFYPRPGAVPLCLIESTDPCAGPGTGWVARRGRASRRGHHLDRGRSCGVVVGQHILCGDPEQVMSIHREEDLPRGIPAGDPFVDRLRIAEGREGQSRDQVQIDSPLARIAPSVDVVVLITLAVGEH